MSGMTADTAILVFAKAPLPGAAKTRLIPLLGAEGAAALQSRLLGRALATARAASPDALQLWCAPDCSHPALQEAAQRHRATLHAQRGNDLGARMAQAFDASLAPGRHTLIIGTDCPALAPRHLQEAAAALRGDCDAVFIPAEDGGYALIGLARRAPALFEDIAWGGPAVMTQTRERLSAAGLRWRELETLWDVDRPEDFLRLQASGLMDEAAQFN